MDGEDSRVTRALDDAAFKHLLELFSALDEQDEILLAESASAGRRRARARKKGILRTLKLRLAGSSGRAIPAWLAGVRNRSRLSGMDLLILVQLIHRRITAGDVPVPGRDVLRLLGESSAELLRHASFLAPDAPLRTAGLVEEAGPARATPLESAFRIHDDVYRLALKGIAPPRRHCRRRTRAARPYAHAVEHFRDLRALVDLAQRRAAALFPRSFWADVHPEPGQDPEILTAEIAEARASVARREEATPDSVILPLRVLRREYRLGADEEMIVLALVAQEITSATPVLPAVEILRLVSASEDEVLAKRELLGPSGPLVTPGLVGLEEEITDKPLLATAYLSDWTLGAILDAGRALPEIGRDERESFRAWLRTLDTSDPFYRHLDGRG